MGCYEIRCDGMGWDEMRWAVMESDAMGWDRTWHVVL